MVKARQTNWEYQMYIPLGSKGFREAPLLESVDDKHFGRVRVHVKDREV
jgi:hypothetical protein